MKKLNQSGEIEDVLLVFAILAIVGLVLLGFKAWSDGNRYQKVLQAWTGDCYNLGGQVQMSGANLVDCFVDGKPCVVSGYAQYQTTNPNPKFNNLPTCTQGS